MATDTTSCRLVAGWFAGGVQGLLAVVAFSTLLFRRTRERPPLEFHTWVLNVGKQVVSLTVAHAFAIVASIFFSFVKNRCTFWSQVCFFILFIIVS